MKNSLEKEYCPRIHPQPQNGKERLRWNIWCLCMPGLYIIRQVPQFTAYAVCQQMICFRCGTQAVSQQVPPRKGFERLFPIRKLFLNLSSHFIQEEIIFSLDTSYPVLDTSQPRCLTPGKKLFLSLCGFSGGQNVFGTKLPATGWSFKIFLPGHFFEHTCMYCHLEGWLKLETHTGGAELHSSVWLLSSETALAAGLMRPELTDVNNKFWEVLHPPPAPFETYMSLARLFWTRSQCKLGLALLLQVCRRRDSSRYAGNTQAGHCSSCHTVRKTRSNLRRLML